MRRRQLIPVGLAALLVGCGAKGFEPRPFPDARGPDAPGTTAPTEAPAAPASAIGKTIAGRARALIGTPYRLGGDTPDGFDCSGLVHYVFRQSGLQVPRTVQALAGAGRRVEGDHMTVGDLVFFRTNGRRVSHVGIVNGDGTFIHAPTSRGVVREEPLSGYWRVRFAGARRIP